MCVCVCCVVCQQIQNLKRVISKRYPVRACVRSFMEFAPSTDCGRSDPGGTSEKVSPVELASLIKAS